MPNWSGSWPKSPWCSSSLSTPLIDLPALIRSRGLPLRLLLIGLPLTMGLGILLAYPLFPHLSFWLLALMALILSPTDAALGQAVVKSESVPEHVRQAINVESGLNDGIALPHWDGRAWIYAVLSLTVIRMLPVALSLIGSGLDRNSVGFIGWFGPRGIASILYLIMVVGKLGVPKMVYVLAVIVLTVLLSVLAHGITAVPLAGIYGRYLSKKISVGDSVKGSSAQGFKGSS